MITSQKSRAIALRRGTYGDPEFELTPQRLAILDDLDGNREHPSVEVLFRAARLRNNMEFTGVCPVCRKNTRN